MLPVRPDPVTGESLRSYVARVAAANHLRPTEVLKVTSPHRHYDLRQLAAMTGIAHENLEALSWNSAPAALVGHGGSTGWVLRTTAWCCRSCLRDAGVLMRDWELACLPVCR